jgi:hypothetical protein
VFTAEVLASWTAFTAAVDDLQAVQVANNTVGNWVGVRETITALFGVDLAPLEVPQLVGAPVNVQQDPDADFICHEPVRARLVAAGTGRDIALGQKSIMVFIVENYVKPHDAFTGDRDEDSIKELFDRLEEVHLAPVTQASYKIKIEAVFKCLSGGARDSVIGYKGAATRSEYLDLWKSLLNQFGNKAHEVSRQMRMINSASPKSSEGKEVMKFMNILKNAAVQLNRLDHAKDQTAGLVWNSLRRVIPDLVAEYCRRKVPSFDEEWGSDVATWHSVDGLKKFDNFYSYVLAYSITEASVRTETPVMVVGHAKDEKSSEPASEASVNKAALEENPTPRAEEPPTKKSRLEEPSEGTKKGFKGKKKKRPVCFFCGESAHVWENCYITIDGKLELFARENRCYNCASLDHTLEECPHPPQCDNCRDPNRPKRGAHHPSLCFIKHGYPTRSKGAQRGNRGGNRGGHTNGRPQQNTTRDQNVAIAQTARGEQQRYSNTTYNPRNPPLYRGGRNDYRGGRGRDNRQNWGRRGNGNWNNNGQNDWGGYGNSNQGYRNQNDWGGHGNRNQGYRNQNNWANNNTSRRDGQNSGSDDQAQNFMVNAGPEIGLVVLGQLRGSSQLQLQQLLAGTQQAGSQQNGLPQLAIMPSQQNVPQAGDNNRP